MRRKVLEQVAEEKGASANQVIYAWMMQSDPVVIPLIAVSKMEHLKENLDSINVQLSDDQMNRLNNPEF